MKKELEWWFELQEEIEDTRQTLMGHEDRINELERYRIEEAYEKTIKTKYYNSKKVYFGQMCRDELPSGYGAMYRPTNMVECFKAHNFDTFVHFDILLTFVFY